MKAHVEVTREKSGGEIDGDGNSDSNSDCNGEHEHILTLFVLLPSVV